MDDNPSLDRLVRNEYILRNKNVSVKNAIKRFFRQDRDVKSAPLEFVCECSDLECRESIKISIDSYEQLHTDKNRFMIVKGHNTPAVENVVARKKSFDVVEKTLTA